MEKNENTSKMEVKNEPKKSESVHFRVSGKITKLLGRESVSESITALFEVLKNSHDADAENVTVSFHNIFSGTGEIIIKEKNGDGMTLDDIENKFFVIGTYSKEGKDGLALETSRLKRRMLGSKGVGRFALERLGHDVKIISRPINTEEEYVFLINWDRFSPKEITVDQIGIEVIPQKRTPGETSGLEIHISRFRDEWDLAAIKKLESKIQRLILPKKFQPPNAFNIILDAPEFGYQKKEIYVELLARSYYYLKAELLDDRIILSAKEKSEKVPSKITEKDEDDTEIGIKSKIEEFIPYQHGGRLTKTEKKHGLKKVNELTCGHAILQVYYFPIFQANSPERRDAMRHYGEAFAPIIDSELPKHSGVRIFRDGTREFTYGDSDNDWVERSSISRNLSGAIQSDRLIGYVLISNKENPGIISTVNRESAIQNQQFLDLKEFVIQSMLEFDRYLNKKRRKTLEDRQSLKRDSEAVDQLKVIKKTLTDKNSPITKAFKKVHDLTGEDYTVEIDHFLDAIDNAAGRLEDKIEKAKTIMNENQIERSLASLGVLISMMIHEVNDGVRISYRHAKSLKNVKHIHQMNEVELSNIISELNHYLERIHTWSDFVDTFSSNLTLEDISSRREEIINPYEITEKFSHNIIKILNVGKIKISNEINKKLQLKMFTAYFESIIGNLLSNSIKAIQEDENKEITHEIIIKTEKTSDHLTIIFSDNGIGINKDRWEEVFEPHISSTKKLSILKGRGLGLPIVNSMIKQYDGEIEIVEPIQAKGTTFRIILPWNKISPIAQ